MSQRNKGSSKKMKREERLIDEEKEEDIEEKKGKEELQPPKKAKTREGIDRNAEEFKALINRVKDFPPTRSNWHLHQGFHHLSSVEPKLIELFLKYDLPSIYLPSSSPTSSSSTSSVMMPVDSWNDPPFSLLCQIIVYQQLSGASAKSVWNRFLSCFESEGKSTIKIITPELLQQAKFSETIDSEGKKKILINQKISGLSSSKAKYLQSLTQAFLDENQLKSIDWMTINDEDLYNRLIAVKGLGMWSVHMFMMFGLHRSNVLPLGDLGIRRGLCRFYNLPKGHLEKKQNLQVIETSVSTWAPYSSLAAFYLWKYSEKEEVEEKEVKEATTVTKNPRKKRRKQN